MKLSDIQKKNGFTVPENYFENQKKELLKIPNQAPKGKLIKGNFGWTTFAAAAAVLAIIFTLGYGQFTNQPTESTELNAAVLYSDVELEYYSESIEELSYDLADQALLTIDDTLNSEEEYLLDYTNDQLYYEL